VPKYFILLTRPEGVERAAFQQATLEAAPRWLECTPGTRRLVVNLVDVEPPAGAPESPYDVAIEGSYDSADEFEDAYRQLPAFEQDALPRRCIVYQVRERVQLERERAWQLGERSPGVKVIYLVRRNEALSDAEAAQRWKEHAPLARKHHAGMAKYVQNAVLGSPSPDAPLVHGIAELHFPTREDREQRMYDSAEGREALAADVTTLVAESLPLYTSEYVLRD
jgi:hypothetical protein